MSEQVNGVPSRIHFIHYAVDRGDQPPPSMSGEVTINRPTNEQREHLVVGQTMSIIGWGGFAGENWTGTIHQLEWRDDGSVRVWLEDVVKHASDATGGVA